MDGMKLTKHLAALEGRNGGTYVLMTRDNAWGRGETLGEAAQNARRSGARKLGPKDTLVAWQPAAAYGDKPPAVNEYGQVCYYGEPGSLVYLHRPKEA